MFNEARRLWRQADKVRVVASAMVWRGLCSQDVAIKIGAVTVSLQQKFSFYSREKLRLQFTTLRMHEIAVRNMRETVGKPPETVGKPLTRNSMQPPKCFFVVF